MKITEFDIEIPKDMVMHLLSCEKDNEVYDTVSEEFEEMLAEAYEKLSPVALLEFGDLSGISFEQQESEPAEALFCIVSVGRRISEWSSALFAQGAYLKGMIADAMADAYLFQMDHQLAEQVIKLCRERGRGVARRLEAPQDIPLEVQKKAHEAVKAEEMAGIRILKSFMYDPVKSLCQVYLLDQNREQFRIRHDCSRCPVQDCKMRRCGVNITVKAPGRPEVIVQGDVGQTMTEILRANGVYHSAICGGRGTCGKCGVRVLEGELPVTGSDRDFFSEAQLQQGYRLSCCAQVKGDCTIVMESGAEEAFSIVTDYHGEEASVDPAQDHIRCGIAADIGTTTIAMQLIGLDSGVVFQTYRAINGQRSYGADVISRILASNRGQGQELQNSIRQDLIRGINELTQYGRIPVAEMVIAANTTMIHLLMGYSCQTLGRYPFKPVNIDPILISCEQLLGTSVGDFDITLCPGISTFVGGDITAGLYALSFDKKEQVSVLIDFGTNGEMAVGNKDRILVTSTAAGPAFEGGNITCGTGSIPGAISSVTFQDGQPVLTTIDNQPVKGICGTGVIDIACGLLQSGLMDETGLLQEEYFEGGFELGTDENGKPVTFYQKDIRELQLAKSAVRAGLETLVLKYGVSWQDIETVYLAGGFGHGINVANAISIGLLPEECRGKAEVAGNTCLKGACLYLLEKESDERTQAIRNLAEEIQLAKDEDFNRLYMEHMYFEEI